MCHKPGDFQYQHHLLIIFILIIFSSSIEAQSEPQSSIEALQWHDWSDKTFALAQQQNKLVLLDIGAQWCQFCKKMDAVTYRDPEVVKIINEHYIAIKADIEESAIVQQLYGHLGVPGTVILDANKVELNKRLGYIAPQPMQWHLLGSLQDAESEISTHP